MRTLGERCDVERLADRIARVRKVTKAVEQSQSLEHGRIDPDADGRIALFDPLQRNAGRKCPIGDHTHRQPATAPRVVKVLPKLAERSTNASGGMMRCRHVYFAFH